MKAQEKETWRAWVDKNPIRVWMNENHIYTTSELASRLGATLITVNAWLLGLQIPRAERMERIEKVTGITKEQWLKWFDARP